MKEAQNRFQQMEQSATRDFRMTRLVLHCRIIMGWPLLPKTHCNPTNQKTPNPFSDPLFKKVPCDSLRSPQTRSQTVTPWCIHVLWFTGDAPGLRLQEAFRTTLSCEFRPRVQRGPPRAPPAIFPKCALGALPKRAAFWFRM